MVLKSRINWTSKPRKATFRGVLWGCVGAREVGKSALAAQRFWREFVPWPTVAHENFSILEPEVITT